MTTEYRDIPGFPGYRVGSDGTVWSCRKIKGSGYGKAPIGFMSDTFHELKSDKRKIDGRKRYTVRNASGKFCKRYASHLVLFAFSGPRPEGQEACHNNGNCLDDSVSNVRWGTSESNKADMNLHGTQRKGRQIQTAKLTESDVSEIRKIGKPLKQHAERYGVSETLISLVLQKRIWKHVA